MVVVRTLMKLTTFTVALFLTLQTVGQSLTVVTQLLRDKKFQPFRKYIDAAPESNVNSSWKILREVAPGYWEGVVKIEEFRNANDGTCGNNIYNYRIDFLTTERNIFYSRFIEIRYKEVKENQWEPYDSMLETFTDRKVYRDFKNAFTKNYNENLNSDELFLTFIVYGRACGMAGTQPEYQQKLTSLLGNKDIRTISAWLRSPNTEKQLYGMQGLKALEINGYNFTDEEKRLINILRQKQGRVNTCSGCTYSSEDIQDVVASVSHSKQKAMSPLTGNKNNLVNYGVGALIAAAVFLLYFKRRTG